MQKQLVYSLVLGILLGLAASATAQKAQYGYLRSGDYSLSKGAEDELLIEKGEILLLAPAGQQMSFSRTHGCNTTQHASGLLPADRLHVPPQAEAQRLLEHLAKSCLRVSALVFEPSLALWVASVVRIEEFDATQQMEFYQVGGNVELRHVAPVGPQYQLDKLGQYIILYESIDGDALVYDTKSSEEGPNGQPVFAQTYRFGSDCPQRNQLEEFTFDYDAYQHIITLSGLGAANGKVVRLTFDAGTFK